MKLRLEKVNDVPECRQLASGKDFNFAVTHSQHVHCIYYASSCIINVLLFFSILIHPPRLKVSIFPDLAIPLPSLVAVMTICLGLILKKEREKEKLYVVEH